jgi:hypothetical protein
MADDRINETSDAEAVEKIANKAGASDHRAGSDRRARIGECKLEDPNSQECNARRFVRCGSVLQEEPVITDKSVAVCKHESKANGIKQDAAKACVNHAFHKDIHGFARPAEAGFEHREPNLHSENQEGSNQRPHGLHRIYDVVPFQVGIGGEGVATEQNRSDANDAQDQRDANPLSDKQKLAVAPPLRISEAHAKSMDLFG